MSCQQNPKYPSEAVVCDWYSEWEDHLAQLQLAGEPEECLEYFIARKACDWQREQDALICESIGTFPVAEHYSEGMRDMQRQAADAIRSGASHD